MSQPSQPQPSGGAGNQGPPANVPQGTQNNIASLIPLLGFVLGIPAATIIALWEVIGENIPLLIGGLFFSEVVVVFFGGIIVTLYKDRFKDKLISLLYDKLITFFTRQKSRYFKALSHRHWDFDVKGFSTQGPYNLDLEEVFVELAIAPRSFQDACSSPIEDIPEELRRGSRPVWEFLKSGVVGNLAVIGAPGSGKTTLAKHICLIMAGKRKVTRKLEIKRLFPLLLFLRHHSKAIDENPSISLGELAEKWLISKGYKLHPGWLEKQLMKKNSLVILDGLDEVADPKVRRVVVQWVEDQLKSYYHCRFIVTSRPGGYQENPLCGVTVLSVLPFNRDQVKVFVERWYLANERRSTTGEKEKAEIKAREGAEELLKKLAGNKALSELAVNPLLLTMIATVHRFKSHLPGRRVELYKEICEVFLGKRQLSKGIEDTLSHEQKQAVLAPLAYEMMVREKREIPGDEAIIVIKSQLERVAPEINGADFLKLIEGGSGLLVTVEEGVFGFSHLTFQEYLCALYMKERKLVEELESRVADSWWHEVIRLYVATADASSIIASCIEQNPPKPEALFLAFECREEAKEISPDVREKIDEVLKKGADHPDPEIRRIVGMAFLIRRLGKMIRIDEERQITPEPVTNVEYQLFLETEESHKKYAPLHWKELIYSKGTGNLPVTGLLPADCVAFCRWLKNEGAKIYPISLEENFKYRLPKQPEMEGISLKDSVSVWIVNASKGSFYSLDKKKATYDKIREWQVQDSFKKKGLSEEWIAFFQECYFSCYLNVYPKSIRNLNFINEKNYLLSILIFVVNEIISKYHANSIVLDFNLDLDLIGDLARDFVRAQNLINDLAHDCTRDRDRDRDLIIYLDLDSSLAYALIRELARDLDRYLPHDIGLTLDLDRMRNLGLSSTHNNQLTINYRTSGRAFIINCGNKISELFVITSMRLFLFLLHHQIYRNLGIVFKLKFNFKNIMKRTTISEIHAIKFATILLYHYNNLTLQKKELPDINTLSFIKDFPEIQKLSCDSSTKYRHIILELIKRFYEHLSKGSKEEISSVVEKARASSDDFTRLMGDTIQALGEAYMTLTLRDLRREGKAEAFESFIFVRERVREEE